MLDIPIDIGGKEYRLQSDVRQYILCRKSWDKKVEDYRWSGFKFWVSLSQAFEAIMHMKIRTSSASTMEDLEQQIKVAEQEVRKYWLRVPEGV